MPVSTAEARRLCTVNEWTLVESSRPAYIKTLTPVRLRAKIARARTMRNKYRDLAKRQHRRSQASRHGAADEVLNARTNRKAELFDQVLAAFEARLASLTSKPAAPKRAAAKSAKPIARTKAPKAARGVKTVRGTRTAAIPVAARSGQHRVHAHVSSRGRRQQGRRDSRRT